MRRLLFLFVFATFGLINLSAQDKMCKAEEKEDYPWENIKDNFISVLFFLNPECPLCKDYSTTINTMVSKYGNDSIQFYGIFSGSDYTQNEIKQFNDKFTTSLLNVYDTRSFFAKKLKATVTPECFLLSRDGKVQYRGSIDNWVVSLGKKRQLATERYLENNLVLLIKEKKLVLKSTKAYGCLLE